MAAQGDDYGVWTLRSAYWTENEEIRDVVASGHGDLLKAYGGGAKPRNPEYPAMIREHLTWMAANDLSERVRSTALSYFSEQAPDD